MQERSFICRFTMSSAAGDVFVRAKNASPACSHRCYALAGESSDLFGFSMLLSAYQNEKRVVIQAHDETN
jgi:hypothetical protein